MQLEKFEQEYLWEIEALKSVQFKTVQRKEFLYPAYQFLYKRAVSFAFAVPAFALMFAFFFQPGNNASDTNLAMLEDSNMRILAEINSLEE